MKCTHCSTDTKYKDRLSNGNRCAGCRHPFAFEPKSATTLGMTDGLFARIIKDVSGDGQVSFTDRQLWYEYNRRMLRKRYWRGAWGTVTGLSALGGIVGTVVAFSLFPVNLIATCAGAGGVAYGVWMNKRTRGTVLDSPVLPFETFKERYLTPWEHVHGALVKLVRPPALRGAPPRPVSAELKAYSFDRALVTQDAETAAMLVANNFHFENNCAILSMDGYPADRFGTIMEMLRKNPRLTVFAIHSASLSGCLNAQALREDMWFPDRSIRVVDLGLRPQHARKLRLIALAGERCVAPPPVRSGLTQEELTWLETGFRAELAAMRPAKLMRSVYQGFARANRIGEQTEGNVADPGGIYVWGYDGGADIYAADSFG